MKLPENESAYIAGIFDGEGTITGTLNAVGQPHFYAAIANTNLELLEWIQVRVGGVIDEKRRSAIATKTCYELSFRSIENLIRFLEEVQPYLRVKKRKVDIVLLSSKVASVMRPGQRLDDKTKLIRLKFWEMFKELK